MSGGLERVRLSGFDEARADWTRLAERTRNVFSTVEWAETWWRHFGGEHELRLTACRNGNGETVALLPLYLALRRPLGVLRFVGHGPSDELGPVADPADAPAAAGALRTLLAERGNGARLLLAERLAAAGGWDAALGGRLVRREPSPVLPFEWSDWDEFLASRSRNFRDQARRRERKLARSAELNYRLATDPERLDADMQTLFDLHAERWEGSGSFDEPRRAFHRDFARVALERGWLRLWFLELDGRPVAAWYGFRFGGAESFYQSGRDPSLEREAVGFVLLCHTIREAMNDGLDEYRLLRGGESYKDRFATADRPVDTIVAGPGQLPRALGGLAVRVDNMPPRPRRYAGRVLRLARRVRERTSS